MKDRRLLLLLLVGLALVPASVGQAQPTRLVGTVGPGFTIGLTDTAGTSVRALAAGRYDVLVRDLSDEHNFVLGHKATGRRPISTEVDFVGDVEVTVDLAPGQWVFACSPHFQTMNGQFSVNAPTPPPDTPRRLNATVTPSRVSLTPRRTSPGRYLITVADRSATRGFRLAGPRFDRRTGNAFRGTASWRVRLVAGTYRFGDGRRFLGRLIVR
jgi:hypothetical protein